MTTPKKVLVLQGANMAFLSRRQPELYGRTSAAELDGLLLRRAAELAIDLSIFYTHVEGEAIDRIYSAVDDGIDGVLMNPAGFLYAGHALWDCMRAVPIPMVEVHMTSIEAREMKSITAEAAADVIAGFGISSYLLGLDALLEKL